MRRAQPSRMAGYGRPGDGDFAATERDRTARSVSLGMVGSPGWLLADRPRLDSSQGLGEAGSISVAAQWSVFIAADADALARFRHAGINFGCRQGPPSKFESRSHNNAAREF